MVAKPPKIPIFHRSFERYSNENIARVTNCTNVPVTNAIATDRKMPSITESALPVLRRSVRPRSLPSAAIFISATAKAAPSSSNTIDTVVDVGMPSELKMSRRMMSVTITAMKMHISS